MRSVWDRLYVRTGKYLYFIGLSVNIWDYKCDLMHEDDRESRFHALFALTVSPTTVQAPVSSLYKSKQVFVYQAFFSVRPVMAVLVVVMMVVAVVA